MRTKCLRTSLLKWVCIDHYRGSYQEKVEESFGNAVEAQSGSFDKNTDRVEVILPSRLQTEQFYLALKKARSIYGLKVELYRNKAISRKLRGTLTITSVTTHDAVTSEHLSRSIETRRVHSRFRHRYFLSLFLSRMDFPPCVL